MNERWITIEEVAQRLHVSRPTAKARLVSGAVPGLTEHYGISRVERETFEKWHSKQGKNSGK